MQVCLCFCLDLPSCFSIRWCQQNASAACHRLSPHPSSSSSSFRRPPFSRAGQGTPGTLPRVRRSAGSGWQRGEPRQAGCPWRRPDMCSRVFRPVPLCGAGGHPPAIAVGCVLNQNQGVPRGLAVTLPARAHGEVLHGRGNQEGPFSPWLK